MSGFAGGMAILLDPYMLGVILAGTVLGVIVGALPGLSGSTTTALLLPLTIGMGPVASVAFLGSIYCAANFGGSITAILINTPGDPSASATAYDGYPMAARGEAGRALGMSAVASAIGGIFSILVMVVATPLLARMAYNFGPPEYFALALFGLSMLGAVGGEGGIRNLIAGAFGVLLATIGLDLTTGIERFTFGIPQLSEGIGIVPVLTGLFAMSEMLVQASQLHIVPERLALTAVRLPSLADFRKCAKAISLSSLIGVFIGILPALGATAAALISYSETKRWSKYKHEFGKGAIEGVAGPEAANNAAVGGNMVPTLALGIPGSATTAIILAGLLVQGVRPGPHLFTEQPTLLWAVFSSMLASNLIYLVLGLFAAKLFARITLIPDAYLWPAVFVFAIVGAYGPDQSMMDVWVMLLFGVVGFVFRRYGFSPAPLVMGLVLGKMTEESLKQSLLMFDQNWLLFFTRPIVIVLFVVTLISVLMPLIWPLIRRAFRREPVLDPLSE
ncbi:MAG TPA: tripartite tricarboxylate transporter permease [Beijerinckiaceae bacterium]|jgi:putative tricarboxylic transport membrane protein